MNTGSRREKIEAMLVDDPKDNMLRYMLAMELEKAAEHDRSLELFAGLMAESPPHVPAFLMAGLLDAARPSGSRRTRACLRMRAATGALSEG